MDEYGGQMHDMTKVAIASGSSRSVYEGQKEEALQSMQCYGKNMRRYFRLRSICREFTVRITIELRKSLRNNSSTRVIEAGKTGQPMQPKQPQQNPEEAKLMEIQLRNSLQQKQQESAMKAEWKGKIQLEWKMEHEKMKWQQTY